MKVHAYYSIVGQMPAPEQVALISCWKDSWRRAGWEPVLLSATDAGKHPLYTIYEHAFSLLPTVNAKNYEMACFLRWLAMSAVGGGLMTDYDVVNFGFTPEDIPQNDGEYATILADNNPCPCAVHGSARQFENTARLFAEYKIKPEDVERGDKPHVSDQNVIQRHHELFRPHIHDMCPEVFSRHWKEAKLVHFPHGATHGKNRLGLMQQAMRDRGAM